MVRVQFKSLNAFYVLEAAKIPLEQQCVYITKPGLACCAYSVNTITWILPCGSLILNLLCKQKSYETTQLLQTPAPQKASLTIYMYICPCVCIARRCCSDKKATKIFMRPKRISQELHLAWKSLGQKDEDLGGLRSKIRTGVETTVRQTTPGLHQGLFCRDKLPTAVRQAMKGAGDGRQGGAICAGHNLQSPSPGHGAALPCPRCCRLTTTQARPTQPTAGISEEQIRACRERGEGTVVSAPAMSCQGLGWRAPVYRAAPRSTTAPGCQRQPECPFAKATLVKGYPSPQAMCCSACPQLKSSSEATFPPGHYTPVEWFSSPATT